MQVRENTAHRDMCLPFYFAHFLLSRPGGISPEESTAVQISSFKNMQKVDQSGNFPEPWLRPRNGAPKVRQGKVGGYLDALDDNDIAYLDSIFGLEQPVLSAAGRFAS